MILLKRGEFMKNSLSKEEYIELCDFEDETYVSKSGQAYIEALAKLFPLNNRNDMPFLIDDIVKQPTLSQFDFEGKNDFSLICQLEIEPMRITSGGKRHNEKIRAKNFTSDGARKIFYSSPGVAYMMTCVINDNEYIVKFGQTRTPFVKRLASYNCGVVNNWRTASTTNIKILQSLVAIRKPLNLYIYDCGEPIPCDWHGVVGEVSSPVSIFIEDVMVKKFMKQFHTKPLANVQADATGSKIKI